MVKKRDVVTGYDPVTKMIRHIINDLKNGSDTGETLSDVTESGIFFNLTVSFDALYLSLYTYGEFISPGITNIVRMDIIYIISLLLTCSFVICSGYSTGKSKLSRLQSKLSPLKFLKSPDRSSNQVRKSSWPSRFIELILLILLVLTFFYLEFPALNAPLDSDGTISSTVSRSIAQGNGQTTAAGVPYPRAPLFHHLLAIPIYLFGAEPVVVRSFVVLISAISLLCIYRIGNEIDGFSLGFSASILFLSFVWFRQYALWPRMYPVFIMFFLLFIYSLLRFERQGDYRFFVAGIGLSFLTFLSHRLGVITVIVAMGLIGREAYNFKSKVSKKSLYLLCMFWAGIFGWLAFEAYHRISFSELEWHNFPILFFLQEYLFLFILGLIGLGYYLLTEYRNSEERFRFSITFPLSIGVGYFVYSTIVYSKVPNRERYMIIFIPVLVLLAVYAINSLWTELDVRLESRNTWQWSRREMRKLTFNLLVIGALIPFSPHLHFAQQQGADPAVFDFVSEHSEGATVVGHEAHTIQFNGGKLDYWLMPEPKRRHKYSINGNGEVHLFTGKPIIKNVSELRNVEDNATQVFIVWHSYRRRPMSERMLSHIRNTYYYYPNISHSRADGEAGYEVFTLSPIEGYKNCKVKRIKQKPQDWEPNCRSPGKQWYEFVSMYSENSTILGHEASDVLFNVGDLDYWLMPEESRRTKYSVSGNGEIHKETGKPIISSVSELKKVERNSSQVFIVWHSYRRRAMTEKVLEYIEANYYYYPSISHKGVDRGYEVFSLHPVGSRSPCHVKEFRKRPAEWEPKCTN